MLFVVDVESQNENSFQLNFGWAQKFESTSHGEMKGDYFRYEQSGGDDTKVCFQKELRPAPL